MAYLDRRYETDRANGGLVAKPRTPKKGRSKKNVPVEDEADALVLPEGSTGVRLQGTWLPCEDAIEVAEEYGLLLYARPLIEAQATQTESGPQLVGLEQVAVVATPSKAAAAAPDSPSSNKRKRQRTSKAAAAAAAAIDEAEATQLAEDAIDTTITTTMKAAAAASPKSATRTRTKKSTKADGSVETKTTKTTTKIEAVTGLTQDEIDEQIKKSKDLAKQVQANSATPNGTQRASNRKRRASNERPTADLDHLADDSSVNFVSRQVRRGTRAVRRRPVVSAAGAVGAAAAAGFGALAWFAGGNIDVAQQFVQQGFQSISGFFF